MFPENVRQTTSLLCIDRTFKESHLLGCVTFRHPRVHRLFVHESFEYSTKAEVKDRLALFIDTEKSHNSTKT